MFVSINFEDDELFCVGGEVQSGTRILASLCHIKCKKVKKNPNFKNGILKVIFSGSWQLHKAKRSLRLILLFPERRFGFFLVFYERRFRSSIFLMFVNRRFWERGQEALLVRLEEHLARIRVPD